MVADRQIISNLDFKFNFLTAVTRGDPHITTMDGHFYTFNGLCEFIMIKSVGSVSYLLVQSRTELASSKNPQAKSKATVFTGKSRLIQFIKL